MAGDPQRAILLGEHDVVQVEHRDERAIGENGVEDGGSDRRADDRGVGSAAQFKGELNHAVHGAGAVRRVGTTNGVENDQHRLALRRRIAKDWMVGECPFG